VLAHRRGVGIPERAVTGNGSGPDPRLNALRELLGAELVELARQEAHAEVDARLDEIRQAVLAEKRLTNAETAARLHCAPERVLKLRYQRKLTPYREGARALNLASEVEALVEVDEGPSKGPERPPSRRRRSP
jgi:hypothetical protein